MILRGVLATDNEQPVKLRSTTLHSQIYSQMSRQQPRKHAQSNQKHITQLVHIILFIDYLEKGQILNRNHYVAQLVHLNDEIGIENISYEKEESVLSSGQYQSMKMMLKNHELHFQLSPHSSHSPDLATSDFHLFKKLLGGMRFSRNDELFS